MSDNFTYDEVNDRVVIHNSAGCSSVYELLMDVRSRLKSPNYDEDARAYLIRLKAKYQKAIIDWNKKMEEDDLPHLTLDVLNGTYTVHSERGYQHAMAKAIEMEAQPNHNRHDDIAALDNACTKWREANPIRVVDHARLEEVAKIFCSSIENNAFEMVTDPKEFIHSFKSLFKEALGYNPEEEVE